MHVVNYKENCSRSLVDCLWQKIIFPPSKIILPSRITPEHNLRNWLEWYHPSPPPTKFISDVIKSTFESEAKFLQYITNMEKRGVIAHQ